MARSSTSNSPSTDRLSPCVRATSNTNNVTVTMLVRQSFERKGNVVNIYCCAVNCLSQNNWLHLYWEVANLDANLWIAYIYIYGKPWVKSFVSVSKQIVYTTFPGYAMLRLISFRYSVSWPDIFFLFSSVAVRKSRPLCTSNPWLKLLLLPWIFLSEWASLVFPLWLHDRRNSSFFLRCSFEGYCLTRSYSKPIKSFFSPASTFFDNTKSDIHPLSSYHSLSLPTTSCLAKMGEHNNVIAGCSFINLLHH